MTLCKRLRRALRLELRSFSICVCACGAYMVPA